ncbi:arrestin domain-containing protein 2-like [Ochlerotatus camptorhynchus]|uniref:arrestin domain-containing protein 2-like n=1 Tax=Ochlerotatus camptorhynchus TaxID=644619 RepID=UPI0031CEA687
MPTECEIKFDSNPNGVYFSGQTLTGHVELRLDNPKKVKNLKLIISGCAEVKWTKNKIKRNGAAVVNRSGRIKRETYSGKEEFITSEFALIPRVDDDAIEIPAGTHEYTFSCQIPPQAATSFEGELGKVRYTIRAVLVRPWKFDQTCTIAFTVLQPLDLNQEVTKLGQPKKIDRSRRFCCWPCISGPMSFSIELPVSGYVPGQKIPITVSLNNASNVPIRGIRSKLVRKVYFISQTPSRKTRSVTKTVTKILTPVTNDESDQYTQDLMIPATAPTGKCSILTIDYELKVQIQLGGCRSNQEYTIPITIGTVPFTTTTPTSATVPPLAPTEDVMNVSGLGWIGGMPIPSVANSVPPSSMPLLPNAQMSPKPPYPTSPAPPAIGFLPPSYQEVMNQSAVNMNDGEPNAIGFQAYIPRYPVYNFGSPVRM